MELLTFGIFYYSGHFAFHDGNSGIGRSKINTNDLTFDFFIGIVPCE